MDMTSSASPTEAEEAGSLFEALRRRILRNELPPGARLREQDIADAHGVSRPRVREVLSLLEARGLVDREPNRGAVVRRSGLAELLEIYDVREALEGMCARLAAIRVSPDSWQDLVELFDDPTERAMRAGDMDAYVAHYLRLRARMLEAAQNHVLVATLQPLHDRTSTVMRRLILVTGRAEEGLREHRAVVAALRAGDAEAAEVAKRAQIRGARAALERYHRFVL
jgi:DNA-binding GntR family transcriptional regulator